MIQKILKLFYILNFVGLSFIQASTSKSKKEENYFTFSYLEDWMPEWTRKNDRYLFNALYYDQGGIENGEVEFGNTESKQIKCRMVILTAGDEDFNTLVELERNRIEYSKKQNYCYLHFFCKKTKKEDEFKDNNSSQSQEQECVFPHYWRYLAIWKLFTNQKLVTYNRKVVNLKSIDWVLYMDLDAMFTNYQVKVEHIIEKYASKSTALIISADTKCFDERYPINNGIMLFKNSLFSLQLVFQVLLKQAYRNSLLYNGTNQWNAKGLKDQPLLTNILVQDKNEIDAEKILKYCTFVMEHNLDLNGIIYSSDHITVVSPRVMNSVRRSSTHFRKDNLLWHWRSGDWIAHLSGLTPMASSLRKKFIKQVCDSSPNEVCPFNIIIDHAELVDVENKLSLIRYKKELKLLNQSTLNKTSKPGKKNKNKSKPNKKPKINDPKSNNLNSKLYENNGLKLTKFGEFDSKDDGLNAFKNENINASTGQDFRKKEFIQSFVGPGLDNTNFTSNFNSEVEQHFELSSKEELIQTPEHSTGSESTWEVETVPEAESFLKKEHVSSSMNFSDSDLDSVSISDTTIEQVSEQVLKSTLIIEQNQPNSPIERTSIENLDLNLQQLPNNMEISQQGSD
ncbi:uncharacterized protein ELE39_003604 [Cryptosporidium sp. chipmunk genotype I]|uniref:uncharacterized protein n=1 Tax=Cryptosporidium sp. chipmunk genotype I TaxID=1280935 RepID=UPI00351A1783|nr:hypothetical protein ELE39_003604 [Cryptosporidium sp. chipmunk genotype I]